MREATGDKRELFYGNISDALKHKCLTIIDKSKELEGYYISNMYFDRKPLKKSIFFSGSARNEEGQEKSITGHIIFGLKNVRIVACVFDNGNIYDYNEMFNCDDDYMKRITIYEDGKSNVNLLNYSICENNNDDVYELTID